MGWFDEQIQQRKLCDSEEFTEAFCSIADSVTGRSTARALQNDRDRILGALADILTHYGCEAPRDIGEFEDASDEIEAVCRPCGIMYRSVTLEGRWYLDGCGAYISTDSRSGDLVALIPDKFSGKFRYFDNALGKYVKIGRKNAPFFSGEALIFYKPLPSRRLTARDIFRYGMAQWSVKDIISPAALVLAGTLLGLMVPKLNYFLFSEVFEIQNMAFLVSTAVFLLCLSSTRLLMSTVRSVVVERNTAKTSLAIESAMMMRLLSLPADFFKELSSGEITQRVKYANSLCGILIELFFNSGVVAVFSLVYISQLVRYGGVLVRPAFIVIGLTVIFSVIYTLIGIRYTRKIMTAQAKESGIAYSLISGVQKIKLSGAEKRAFAQWGRRYSQVSSSLYASAHVLSLKGLVTSAISCVGMILIFFFSVKGGISVADYYAFDTAYAMVFGAFSSLLYIADLMSDIKPTLEMIRPILDSEPEVSVGKKTVSRLSGNIELSNVSFRYSEKMPPVLDNLSLKIRSGQYVAIVGKTGCGKSTLIRLLLGFEKPDRGAVYYDGKDLSTLDLRSLRRSIGTVLQNGKLFQGDIFSNITVSSPMLTMDDAWEAAELAGMADDIERMPMGMHTLISEGSGGISGGQRQRIMIARAVAGRPNILIFDEATSALDNITQKAVSDALDSLNCTRIVIAHRLSTIRNCDRIIFLDNGKIAEDGTYEELIAKNGLFAELVERQRLDTD